MGADDGSSSSSRANAPRADCSAKNGTKPECDRKPLSHNQITYEMNYVRSMQL